MNKCKNNVKNKRKNYLGDDVTKKSTNFRRYKNDTYESTNKIRNYSTRNYKNKLRK